MQFKLRSKKLLFVIDSLSTGGAQRQMINLAIGLKRRKYQVELFCYAPGDMLAQPLYDLGILVQWYFKNSRFSPGVILALSRLMKKRKYDLVLSFLSTPNFYAIVASQMSSFRRVPVVVSERFCDLPQGVTLIERIVRQFYKFADHIVVNSQHQRNNIARKYPQLKSRLSTIYNGYDLKIFLPSPCGPNNNQLKILTIASVSPYKNGLCLVEALNILRQKYNVSASVTWVGQRFKGGDSLRYLNEMEHKLRANGLVNNWHWLDQRTDIVEQLHKHDVLVHPSYGEGLPNVVCEALACARPVIVSDILDHAKLVEHGESGYLFDWQEPSDLAEKIKMFIGLSPEERKIMGQNGRRYAESHLSIERLVYDYERLLLSIINQRNVLRHACKTS
jgi:glycosyltransferase involved in cell wall biosynthesis